MDWELTDERKALALSKLESLAISESRASKIRNLIENSSFDGVYVDFLLADNPTTFRASLPHNVQFAEEAAELGIDMKVLKEGIDDMPITVPLQEGEWVPSKLIGYYKEFFRGVQTLYQKAVRDICVLLSDGNFHSDAAKKVSQQLVAAAGSKTQFEANLRNFEWKFYDSREASGWDGDPVEVTEKVYASLIDFSMAFYEVFFENAPDFLGAYQVYLDTRQLTDTDLNYLSRETNTVARIKELHSKLRVKLEHLDDPVQELIDQYYRGEFVKDNFELWLDFDQEWFSQLKDHLMYDFDHPVTRYKGVRTADYFCRIEPKDPTDVTFGNDSGCCIAVSNYEGEFDLGNEDAVPYYLLSDSVVIAGVYQQIKQQKLRRVGIVLSFVTVDEINRAILLDNSMELSEQSNPLDEVGLTLLVDHVSDYMTRFEQASGFKGRAIGDHNYNTAVQFINPSKLTKPDYKKQGLMKLPDIVEREFYSEVLDANGISIKGAWSWVNPPSAT